MACKAYAKVVSLRIAYISNENALSQCTDIYKNLINLEICKIQGLVYIIR